MKIKPEHLEQLRWVITPLDTPERRAQYKAGKFFGATRVIDLDMRHRWDLLYAANLSQWAIATLYKYLNDTHIDTALRSIVPPLKESS